jgi:hypothetical protein
MAEARLSAGQIPVGELHLEPGLNEKDGFELLDYSSPLALAKSAQQHLDLSYLDSIKTKGILQPLIVFRGADKKLFVEDGHRRYLRALIAKLIEGIDVAPVPFVFSRNTSKLTTKIDRQMTQLVANATQPAHPWEEARVVRNAVNAGWAINAIAAETGRSVAVIQARYDLSFSPPEAIALLKANQVSVTQVLQMIAQCDGLADLKSSITKVAKAAEANGGKKLKPKQVAKANLQVRLAEQGVAEDALREKLIEELSSFLNWEALDTETLEVFSTKLKRELKKAKEV